MKDTNQLPYCIAPWIHAHIGENGKRGLCCIAKNSPYDASTSIDEFLNSPYVQDARYKLERGEIPQACLACSDRERSLHLRKSFDLLLNSQENYKDVGIISLDYRGDNSCNLRCRMCNPVSSSSIGRLYQKSSLDHDIVIRDGLYSEAILPELLRLLEMNRIRALFFADGEPFVSANHKRIINFIVEGKLGSKISLYYNTNLSSICWGNESILDYLKANFKQAKLTVSLDGIGDVNDFLRDGSRWQNFTSNLDYAIKVLGTDNISLNVIVTTLGIFELQKIHEFASEKKISYQLSNCFYRGFSKLLSPYSLPKKMIDDLLSQYALNSKEQEFRSSVIYHYFQETLGTYEYVRSLDCPISFKIICAAWILDLNAQREPLFVRYENVKNEFFQEWLKNLYKEWIEDCYLEGLKNSPLKMEKFKAKLPRKVFFCRTGFEQECFKKIKAYSRPRLILLSGKMMNTIPEQCNELDVLLTDKIRYCSLFHVLLWRIHSGRDFDNYFDDYKKVVRLSGNQWEVEFFPKDETVFKVPFLQKTLKFLQQIFPKLFLTHVCCYLKKK